LSSLFLFVFFASLARRQQSLIFFRIDYSNSDNDKLVLFVFIKIFRFVMSFFMTFKAFYTTQIFCVINLVNLFARRRRVFENIELLALNKLVDLI